MEENKQELSSGTIYVHIVSPHIPQDADIFFKMLTRCTRYPPSIGAESGPLVLPALDVVGAGLSHWLNWDAVNPVIADIGLVTDDAGALSDLGAEGAAVGAAFCSSVS